ncbi:hypothetical protein C8Q75DRAFT_805300 [Abortiporus biennis]|nr:hypothetical protein C8Q75DRAFT_805300 [Abortiporus biennis]
MSLFSILWGTSQLDDAVDRATSELLPSGAEDIALNLEICDQIRSKSVQPKDAMRALKRRLNHKNPNVQLLALSLTDVCVKNGGDQFLVEIASREFMDNLVSILKIPGLNHDVKNKILRYIQDWSTAFEGKSTLSYVSEVYRTLQREGFNFPPRDPAVTSAAMVDTQTAPEWVDSEVCLRCRTTFTFTNRKHHCRNCGLVFDQQCSSKTMTLPHFGITQEVRVCDSCHAKLSKKPKAHRLSQSVSTSRHRAGRDAYDADLQRAIQLSLQEVGAAGGTRPGYIPSPSSWQISEPPIVDRQPYTKPSEEDDPDLRAAIEASLKEANAPKPSAPLGIETPRGEQASYSYGSTAGYPQSYPPSSVTPKPAVPTTPTYDLEPLESDAILTFSQTVDQVQSQGGRDLSRYPAVSELFDKANGLRPKLAMSLNDTSRKEQILTDMHEKLSQAVRLYDKLLTEQISHPSWRPSPPVASSSTQPASAGYAAQFQPTQYSQWPPAAQQVQSPVMASQPQLGQTSYYSPPQTVASPAPPPQQQFGPPVTIPQYQAPSAYPVSAPSAPVSVPPPPSTHLPSQPLQSTPSPSSALSRHNTIATASSGYTPKYLARSNTVATTHAPQQLQQLQHTSVPAQLPPFPSVPSSPPQQYQTYSSPVPPVEPERKEAMLIEL